MANKKTKKLNAEQLHLILAWHYGSIEKLEEDIARAKANLERAVDNNLSYSTYRHYLRELTELTNAKDRILSLMEG